GRPTPILSKPRDYAVEYIGVAEPTLSVSRPYAYLFPPSWAKVTENLQRHGVTVEELREDIDLDVEVYCIDKARPTMFYQKRQMMTAEATARKEARRVPAGTVLVRTAQPLGTLAAFLLEPQADDGLPVSGRSQPQPTWDAAKIGKAVAALPGVDPRTVAAVRGRAAAEPAGGKKAGDFFRHGDDLYYFAADGSKAVRLTRSPGAKELVTF